MSNRANVQSTAAIESVRNGLVGFVDQVSEALASLELEMRRIMEWLEHDRPRYWKTQTRLAHDGVNEAQAALHRCLMYPVGDERPSCADERAALKNAQARLAYCTAKQERVRHWMRTVEHELFEYQGRIAQLVRLVEIDAPEAIGLLGKILQRLEDYRRISTSSGGGAYQPESVANELWPAESADVTSGASTGDALQGEASAGDASFEAVASDEQSIPAGEIPVAEGSSPAPRERDTMET